MIAVLYLLIAILVFFVVGYFLARIGCDSEERYVSETPIDPVTEDSGSCEDPEILAFQKKRREAEAQRIQDEAAKEEAAQKEADAKIRAEEETAKRKAAEKAAAEKALADKAVKAKEKSAVAERSKKEEAVTQAQTMKAETGKGKTAEKASIEKASAEKMATEKAASEKVAKEKEAAAKEREKAQAEARKRAESEKAAAQEEAGKIAKEKVSAEKTAADKKKAETEAKDERRAGLGEKSNNASSASEPEGLLKAPRNGKKDNLTRIKGIGAKIDEALNGIGIWHFDQIAAWTEENMSWADRELAFPGRAKRDDWVGQAKLLAKGKETEFSKRVDKGEVASSKKA